jgi:hypothetical protein
MERGNGPLCPNLDGSVEAPTTAKRGLWKKVRIWDSMVEVVVRC